LCQSLAEWAKSQVDLLKNAAEREQRITDLEQEVKQVRDAAAAKKKGSRTSLPRRSARPWRLLRSSILYALVGRIFVLMILLKKVFFVVC
jgi:hypothetical protein